MLPSGICAMMFKSQLNFVAGLSALKMTYNDGQYQCTYWTIEFCSNGLVIVIIDNVNQLLITLSGDIFVI